MGDKQKNRGNYLSIDGGTSGLPALYIIDEMGSRMQFDMNLDEEILLWQHFDLIMGTGPGGLVAILIGRLRLTASKAIEAYMKLRPTLSLGQAKNDVERKKNTDSFRSAFEGVLKDAGLQPDSPMLDNDGTKVAVCALNTANLSAAHLIRSYRSRSARPPACTILEAACACVASLDTFLSVTIGTGHKQVTLTDAHAVCANPAKELLREAQRIFGDDAEVATILSIGSGRGDVWSITETNGSEMKDALKRAATSSEPVHEELYARLRETSIYFRLNVDRSGGPQMELSSSRVSAYLQEGEINDRLDGTIKSIERRPNGIKLKDINSVTVIGITLKPRPSLVQNFIGRRDILDALHRTHLTHRRVGLTTPAITVLSGLGGSGKTQTALKFALEFETLAPDVPVYFLNASTEESLKADYETLIHSLGSEHRSKSYDNALRYLEDKLKDWLVILDNADNPHLQVFPYFPKCTHGNVIITTRNSNHATLSPDSNHHLEGLSTEDAIELILSASSNENTEANWTIALQIVEELGHLPLALAQAAAYISVHKCLSTYLSLYHQSTAQLLETSVSQLPSDYPYSVGATIQTSFVQLPAEVKGVLRLFAHLDSTSIAHEIIVVAAKRQFREVYATVESPLNPETIKQADALMKMFCVGGKWSDVDFNGLINWCLQYSLLRLSSQGDSKFYSMHILVQAYLQALSDPLEGCQPGPLIVRLLGSALTVSFDQKYLPFNRLLIFHLFLIKVEDVVEGGDHFAFGQVLEATGYGKEMLCFAHVKRCFELYRTSFGDEHRVTLIAKGNLALSYKVTTSLQQGLKMIQQVLETQKRVLGPEDGATLITMGNLAEAYREVGRHQEALELNEVLLKVEEKVLGPGHILTFRTMGNIAELYSSLGHHQIALGLKEKVIEIQKMMLGYDHPDTLLTMSNTAVTYSALGRHKNAMDLNFIVHKTQTRVLGAEHPDSLRTIRNLLFELQRPEMLEELFGIHV